MTHAIENEAVALTLCKALVQAGRGFTCEKIASGWKFTTDADPVNCPVCNGSGERDDSGFFDLSPEEIRVFGRPVTPCPFGCKRL